MVIGEVDVEDEVVLWAIQDLVIQDHDDLVIKLKVDMGRMCGGRGGRPPRGVRAVDGYQDYGATTW